MKNIIEEKPTDKLHGRTLFNVNFVSDQDIRNKDILDIGCGFGWFELNALNRGCNKIIGTELTENDLDTARKYIYNEKARFAVAGATKLPFEDNSFDTVVSWEVLEHIPKGAEGEMFKEASRVLKRGGFFYLSTPYDSFFAKIFDPAWWLIGHRHYSKEKITNLAESCGLSVEEVAIKGGIWETVGMANLYIAKWIFRRRPFFEKFINRVQNIEYEKKCGFTNLFIKLKRP